MSAAESEEAAKGHERISRQLAYLSRFQQRCDAPEAYVHSALARIRVLELSARSVMLDAPKRFD